MLPARKYDWAGLRFSRGLAPRCEPELPEPHATVRLSPHGDQPMSSQSTTPRSIIYLGMDVHKDSITHRGPAGRGEDADARRSAAERPAEAEAIARPRGARRRAARVLRGEWRRVCAAPRAAGVGLRVRGDRAVAHSRSGRAFSGSMTSATPASSRGSIAPAS